MAGLGGISVEDGRGTGRHTLDEDAVLTPIFHALTRGGWRSRQHEPASAPPDPLVAFRRDPLTAPIPAQVLRGAPPAARRLRVAHSGVESRSGRHHRVAVISPHRPASR